MPELVDVFDYLDDLRTSGVVNMYGAAGYLEQDFGMPKPAARAALGLWMRTYGNGMEPASVRAARAKEELDAVR